MFWGLIMESQKRYSQTVKRSFHVSMAAIDIYSSSDEPAQVMCAFENRKYLLCTLQKDTMRQCPLDLNFETGDKVTFLTNGESHVHLTGYLNDDFMDEEDAEEEEVDNVSLSNVIDSKRTKKPSTGDIGPPAKKTKTMQLLEEINSQDSDSEDDPDINLSDIVDEEDDTTFLEEDEDDDDDAEEGEEEEGGEEAEDEEGGEEEDEDDEVEGEDSDDEEASPLSSDEEDEKPKMNGKAKKANQQEQKKEQKQKSKEKASPKEKPQKEKGDTPKQKKTVEGGVIIEDIKQGNGPVAKAGKMVQVYYEGRFKSNNKMFDSTTKGNGFKFRLGKQEVIKGWDVGVAGMKVGGKRRIICPPPMAYGAKGSPPTIPPNSTLVFEVELKNVK